eukprot:COSAG02_NODE_5696_length_4115_cov_5.925548_2_plen_133_part_00
MGLPGTALLLLCLGAPRRAVADVIGVQLVGERVFPPGHETLDEPAVAGTLAQLGNLTGLAYDHSLGRWFAGSGTYQMCGCPPRIIRFAANVPAASDCRARRQAPPVLDRLVDRHTVQPPKRKALQRMCLMAR